MIFSAKLLNFSEIHKIFAFYLRTGFLPQGNALRCWLPLLLFGSWLLSHISLFLFFMAWIWIEIAIGGELRHKRHVFFISSVTRPFTNGHIKQNRPLKFRQHFPPSDSGLSVPLRSARHHVTIVITAGFTIMKGWGTERKRSKQAQHTIIPIVIST